MNIVRRGEIRFVAFSVLVVGILGIAAIAGFVIADDAPTGEAVLSDVEDQYQSADSVLVEATVTVEHNSTVERVAVTTVATADGMMRVNVSDGDTYVLTGYDGTSTWLESPRMDAPLVLSGSDLAGNASDIGTNATLAAIETTVLAHANDSSAWSNVIENASAGSVPDAINQSALREKVNRSAIPAEWNESAIDAGNWRHASIDGNWSETAAAVERANRSVSTLLAETNLTAERVETTTVDDRDVHVVTVTAPEHDGKLTVWVTADDATVLKQELTTPRGTVTVDMETTFDVSPADSTFQPPIAGGSEQAVDSLADLRAVANVPVAAPGDSWELEEGTVLQSPISVIASQYTADGASITVLQSESALPTPAIEKGRTVDVGERTVTVATVTDAQADETWLDLDDGTVAQWTTNDRTVIVAGNLTEAELLAVVETIEVDSSDR
jgi:outer membrane lipoprotein-sorting protein